MITEDELRDRLHAESASLIPRGDLLQTIAAGHKHRHERARAGLIGGSLGTTALVIALLGVLLTGGPELQVGPATLSEAQIIEKAREADDAAQNMILYFVTDNPPPEWVGPGPIRPTESWALRSEGLGRLIRGDKDLMVAPGIQEEVDAPSRTVTYYRARLADDLVAIVSALGSGDPGKALRNDMIRVVSTGSEIHLRGVSYRTPVEIWLDPKTFLPTRSVAGTLTISYTWLPATAENRMNLVHEVPPDYQRESIPPDFQTGIPSGEGAIPSISTPPPTR